MILNTLKKQNGNIYFDDIANNTPNTTKIEPPVLTNTLLRTGLDNQLPALDANNP